MVPIMNPLALFICLAATVCRCQSPVGDLDIGSPLEKPATLYDETDAVHELYDETIDSLHNSPYIWVIEFYAHW